MPPAPPARRHRRASWRRRLTGRPAGSSAQPRPTVGLVLSGGGSGASFQLGALRYLYDKVGITPSVITGTSAGAILAAVLAQAEDHDGQRRLLTELTRVCEGLKDSSDMLTETEWFRELQKLTPVWQRAITARPARPEPRTITLPRLGSARQRRGVPGPAAPAAGPTIKLPTWEPSPVFDTLSVIWAMGRSGTDFDVIMQGAKQQQSMFEPGPIFDELLDPTLFDPERLAASTTELRLAVVALESGELRYVTGTGALVNREDEPVASAGSIPVRDAIRASCAIPAVYPPVRLGDEHYVDGGTRENAPVQIAVSHLGVDRCYAIISLPKGLEREPSYADKDLLSIVLRSTTGIMADELQLDDVARARAAGAVIIAPEVNLQGLLVLDPGLLRIAMDYGYLRAAEACEGATEDEQQVTRDLVETRRQIWNQENDLFGAGDPPALPQAEARRSLGALKWRLRELVAQVPPGRLPEGAEQWWRRWEAHSWEIAEQPGWTDPADPGEPTRPSGTD